MAESITTSINYLPLVCSEYFACLLVDAYARFSLLLHLLQRSDLNELNCCVSMREAIRDIPIEFWTVVAINRSASLPSSDEEDNEKKRKKRRRRRRKKEEIKCMKK